MASPFPGMDPYLEGELWQEFHETLASAIRAQLMAQISPRYVALLAKRYVLEDPALAVVGLPAPRVLYPDVHVVEPPGSPEGRPRPTGRTVTPPTLEVIGPLLAPQVSIEIRDVAERRLVTIVEILSPANKQGYGAQEYAQRRAELLRRPIHLLEIDLLRGGQRIVLGEGVPPAPYYVYLSRRERRPWTQVWAIGLRDRLPVVPVPLLPPDPDATLDLQAAVEGCFALVGYERLLPYRDPPPPPPLDEADAAWVAEVLRRAGLRE